MLPPERLVGEERRLRFVREARTAAAVTQPSIAVVYEIDEADGVVLRLIDCHRLTFAVTDRRLQEVG